MPSIRPEAPGDYIGVRDVNERAFGREAEADLVDALRRAVHPYLSLVAVEGEEIVGHIVFSPVTVASEDASFTALGLGPMAVLPEHQGRGIGSMLVREGLDACVRAGYDLVVVVGHPSFYPRFGFESAPPKGIRCEYDVPDEVFMVAELRPGALGGRTGTVRYSHPFAAVE